MKTARPDHLVNQAIGGFLARGIVDHNRGTFAAPMPLEAPVTTAIFPSSFFMIMRLVMVGWNITNCG
jgi:hypothetical protein